MVKGRVSRAAFKHAYREYGKAITLLAKPCTRAAFDAFNEALRSEDAGLARRLARIKASETREVVDIMMPALNLDAGAGVFEPGNTDARFYGYTLCVCALHCGHEAAFTASVQMLGEVGATTEKADLLRMQQVLTAASAPELLHSDGAAGGAAESASNLRRPTERAWPAVLLVVVGVLCGAWFAWIASGTVGALRAGLLCAAVSATIVAPIGLFVRHTRRKSAWRWLSDEVGVSRS